MSCQRFFRRGQITIFVLLLGLLGLTVGMSAASRSLSDLKQATFTETGTKALAGAEAGLQYGLARLNTNSGPTPRTDCLTNNADSTYSDITSNIGLTGFTKIKYRLCSDVTDYYYKSQLAVNDVYDLDISSLFPVGGTVNGFRIHWSSTNGAVEAAYLDSSYAVKRYAVNGSSLPAGQNNFATGVSGNGSCGPTGGSYFDITGLTSGLLLRVKTIGVVSDISICPLSGATILTQKVPTSRVEVMATTTGGTVKRLSSEKTTNGLPSVFDNALFSGGSLSQ